MRKILSVVLSFGLLFQQSGLVYAVGELNLANYLSQARNAIVQTDQFRPPQLRYISYDIKSNDFKLLLDKGDSVNQRTEEPKNQRTLESLNFSTPKLNDATQELFNYFLIGLSLPNDTFWVNLRPDAADSIIDPLLEKTDIGKIFLESDLQLKKDTASRTSPQTTEGKIYWDKLYQKAGELFGTENITIPTLTRPWIVPNEVIVRETEDSAYIYKATLKVMLEADYLIGRGGSRTAPTPDQYTFSDPRLRELNQYSTQLIRETILPKLTQEVNSSQRYAKLRQVYYSLVLSRWFKMKYKGKPGQYPELIDRQNLTNLASKQAWDKQTYFSQYQESFAKGEYNLKETVASVFGQSIRSYVSGGIVIKGNTSGFKTLENTESTNTKVTNVLTSGSPISFFGLFSKKKTPIGILYDRSFQKEYRDEPDVVADRMLNVIFHFNGEIDKKDINKITELLKRAKKNKPYFYESLLAIFNEAVTSWDYNNSIVTLRGKIKEILDSLVFKNGDKAIGFINEFLSMNKNKEDGFVKKLEEYVNSGKERNYSYYVEIANLLHYERHALERTSEFRDSIGRKLHNFMEEISLLQGFDRRKYDERVLEELAGISPVVDDILIVDFILNYSKLLSVASPLTVDEKYIKEFEVMFNKIVVVNNEDYPLQDQEKVKEAKEKIWKDFKDVKDNKDINKFKSLIVYTLDIFKPYIGAPEFYDTILYDGVRGLTFLSLDLEKVYGPSEKPKDSTASPVIVDKSDVGRLSAITLNSGLSVRLNGWGAETLREVLRGVQPVDIVVFPPELYRDGIEYGSPEFLVYYNLFFAPADNDAPINLGWRHSNYTFLVAQNEEQKEAIERIITRSFLGSPREFYEGIINGAINIKGISPEDVRSSDIEHFMQNRTMFPTVGESLKIGQFVKVHILGEEFDYKTKDGSNLKLRIERDNNGSYKITETGNGQDLVYQNIITDEYRPPVMQSIAVTNTQIDAHNFLNRPEFGYTILGDSHGFDPDGNNTSILVSVGGKYLLIDGSPATYQITKDLKIPSLDIEYVYLTHTHDDHDAILSRVLNGVPVKLIATPAVYANFVAKAKDKLRLYGQDINIDEWVDYIKILPGQKLPIFNGKAIIECPSFYNKHTVPTSAVKIGYVGQGGDIENSIAYTADTQLDPRLWEFVEKSDAIFHDAGVLPLHPSPAGVDKQITNEELRSKVRLVHASKKDIEKAGKINLGKGDLLKSTSLIPADFSERAKNNDNIREYLAAVAYLSSLSPEALQALAKKTKVRNFFPGDKIVKQGETIQYLQPSADVLYLIVSGEAKVNIGGKEIRLKPGMTFGEFSAVNPLQPRSVDVVAGDNGLVAISFSKATIVALIKDFPEVRESVERIQHNLLYLEKLSEIEKSPFNQLPIEVLYDLAEKLKVVEFEKGKDILIEGEQSGSEGAYIITEGQVEVTSKSGGKLKEIYNSSPDNVVGEGAFFAPEGKRNATVTAVTKVKALHIAFADFQKALEHHPSLKYKFYVLSANRRDENNNNGHQLREMVSTGSALTIEQEVRSFFESLPANYPQGKEEKPSWDEKMSLLENIEKVKEYLAVGIGIYSKLAQSFLMKSNFLMHAEIDELLESDALPESKGAQEYFSFIDGRNKFQEYWNNAFDLEYKIKRGKKPASSSPPDINKAIVDFRSDFESSLIELAELKVDPNLAREVKDELSEYYTEVDRILKIIEKDIKSEYPLKFILGQNIPPLEAYEGFINKTKKMFESAPPPIFNFKSNLGRLLETFNSAYTAALPLTPREILELAKKEINETDPEFRYYHVNHYISYYKRIDTADPFSKEDVIKKLTNEITALQDVIDKSKQNGSQISAVVSFEALRIKDFFKVLRKKLKNSPNQLDEARNSKVKKSGSPLTADDIIKIISDIFAMRGLRTANLLGMEYPAELPEEIRVSLKEYYSNPEDAVKFLRASKALGNVVKLKMGDHKTEEQIRTAIVYSIIAVGELMSYYHKIIPLDPELVSLIEGTLDKKVMGVRREFQDDEFNNAERLFNSYTTHPNKAGEILSEIIDRGNDIYVVKYKFMENEAESDSDSPEIGVSSAIGAQEVVSVTPMRGGIDLTDRAMRIKLERVGSFASSALILPEIANVEAFDLDKEYEQIQAMVSSSIRPSDTRILEFAAACYYRGEFDQRLTQVSSCIKAAHLADEISGRDSSEALRLATMLPDALYGG